MSLPKHIQIGSAFYPWRDILAMRRDQAKRERQPQPTLFPLIEDRRPEHDRSAADRYTSPGLFDMEARHEDR